MQNNTAELTQDSEQVPKALVSEGLSRGTATLKQHAEVANGGLKI